MNKKAFTLIELIASIIILVVIVLISTPNIIKMIDKARETSRDAAQERVLDAAQEYIYSYNRNVLTGLVEEGDTRYVSIDALLSFGLIKQADVDLLDSDTVYIALELDSNLDLVYDFEYDETVVVLPEPYIVVLGNNPYYVEVNSTFSDPGVAAYDADGKNITSSVAVTGTVNTSEVNQYTLLYNVTDSNGDSYKNSNS